MDEDSKWGILESWNDVLIYGVGGQGGGWQT